jgi:hypothetical protein
MNFSKRGSSMARFIEVYLGDGAYVYLNAAGQVILYTSNGISETNVVALEPEVLKAFLHWIEQTKTKLEDIERGG